MDELIRDFVAETREGIEALDSELVRFEQTPDDPELLGEIFRLIHTLKGTCGFIGLARLQRLAHAAETVLGGFRDGTLQVTGAAVTAILESVDVIRSIVDDLAVTGVEPDGDDSALIDRLNDVSQAAGAAEPAAAAPTPAPAAPTAPKGPLLGRLGGEATIDAACEMTISRLSAIPGGEVLTGADPDFLQGILRDALVNGAQNLGNPADLPARLGMLTGKTLSAELVAGLLAAIAQDLLALDIKESDVAEVMGTFVGLFGATASAVEAEMPSQDAMPEFSTAESEKPEMTESANPTPSIPTAEKASAGGAASSAAKAAEAQANQTIRVGVDALENLMTVASELVLIRNQLLQLLRADPESAFAAPLHRLNQVASELQEGVMTTRMQPINGAWAKLPRLVRDLANDLGKKIDLVMKGQDTELDRQVMELIKDPLTHMIRNAADHGLETPEERRKAGKPETGRILLSARHEGGAIVIEMSDDGRGLPAEKIRAKAVANGIITPQQAQTLSDTEACQLIFLPGFSTATEVTSVSGRGVGMDVVRTNIEKIGGAIELSSVEGKGTNFTIRIPLTLTIVSALIVECCGVRFAMPQSSVVELVGANDTSGRSIDYINGTAVLRLRDRLLPLVSLQTMLGLPSDTPKGAETCIVVAKVGNFTFGVIVDRVFDTEEIVVKPVSSVLRHIKLYSGATILGDGAVIMILDFKGMSLEAGAANASATGDEDVQAAAGVDRTALLVFRTDEGALKAAPLASVARIEEVTPEQIEFVNGGSVIQYRGRLMPVVGPDGGPVRPAAGSDSHPMLVFTRDDRSVGLRVAEIVDTVECTVTRDLEAAGEGTIGSLIIADRATELIDIDFYWNRAMGLEMAAAVSAKASTPTADIAGRPPVMMSAKRLLVVDQSPFIHLLLRPLLAQAGYDVTVATSPEGALAMHNAGETFDLIMADTSTRGPQAQRFALAFAKARRWHATPMLGIELHSQDTEPFDGESLLSQLHESLAEVRDAEPMRGAA